MNTAENRAHWDQRAALGAKAGTPDLILKELEQRAILAKLGLVVYHRGNGRGLEVGCGTGETARIVAAHFRAKHITAIDSSEAMIREAKASTGYKLGNIAFELGDVMHPPEGPFDVVYSQRCLINLPTWEAQRQAIDAIADRLVPGGRFLMCEHSQEGLDAINEARQSWNRPPLPVVLLDGRPRNRYLRHAELATITSLTLVECVPFSATYYYNSRILNDKLAEAEGLVPDYDAKINRLALRLPGDCAHPRYAMARLWVWRKD